MKSHKQIHGTVLQWVIILGIYSFLLISSYSSGDKRSLYNSLALIPLFFLCWGLSLLISGRTVRAISKHLTDEERIESSRLASSYGGKLGLFVAGPFALLCGLLYAFWGVRSALAYIGIFCLVMGLASPFMFRHWKEMRAFMLSTEYANKQGYNKRSANQTIEPTGDTRAGDFD